MFQKDQILTILIHRELLKDFKMLILKVQFLSKVIQFEIYGLILNFPRLKVKYFQPLLISNLVFLKILKSVFHD